MSAKLILTFTEEAKGSVKLDKRSKLSKNPTESELKAQATFSNLIEEYIVHLKGNKK